MARKVSRILILFSKKSKTVAINKRGPVPNQLENTFATADRNALAISAHSSVEMVKGGASRT